MINLQYKIYIKLNYPLTTKTTQIYNKNKQYTKNNNNL